MRREGGVEGREPTEGCVPWGEIVRVPHYGEQAREKWARGLIWTQSGVKLRLYVECRGGEEVCEKRGLFLSRFSFFLFFL